MNVLAYVDEAGAKGFSRKLTADRDDEIGLISAVLFPADRVDGFRELFRPGFDAFCAAAPEGEKHHFTDAFRPGNEAWAAVARTVRAEFEALILAETPPIVYDARRLRLQRAAHDAQIDLRAKAEAARTNTNVRVPKHPSQDRVESQLIDGLTLKLDALAIDAAWSSLDLCFDEVDDTLADHYRARIDRLRSMSTSITKVKGWDLAAGASVTGSIQIDIDAGFDINVRRIGEISVAGKSDPLILVADMVANSLHRHLKDLPCDARLNAPSSIASWNLESRVYGVRDDALEDIL